MPDAIITSTASTFGTISGTFAADQSTIVGTVAGSVVGNLSGSVGVPGPAGQQGPVGPVGPPGPPGVGGTWGSILGDITAQTDLWTQLGLKAPLASPLFTGDPRGPTPALGDNDTSLATTAFVQQELLSGTANAKNLEVYVRNQTGSTIPAGSIVYINGATGNRPTVTLAQANNDANSAQTFGFVKTAIANNGFGYVIVRGELENIDTSALTEGVQLYLSPTTPGAWTTTKPSAPQHLVYVGIVVRSHPTQGVILVAVQNGYELNELHDVAISSPTNGQVLKYDSSTNLWYNGTDSSGVAWGGITGTLSAQTDLQTALDGKYSTSNPAGYITSSALTPYLTSATAASTYQTIAGMSSYLTTSAAASTYYPLTNPSGYITSSALAGYATESWVTSQGYLVDAPSDGNQYLRQNGAWTTVSFPPDFISSVSSPLSVTSGDLSIDLSAYETVSSAASTYQTIAGMSSYLTTASASATYQTISGMNAYLTTSAAASTYLTQANAASTYFTIANAASKANLASPTFTGVPAAPTATAGTSTTQIATTAFVTTADNLKANLASPTFTGTPAAPTAAADTNTTQLATTAYVVGQAGSATPLVNGTAAVGTSLRYARQDHVHPTDTTRAPLASPAFTGTPSLPTGTTAVTQSAGNNTTAVATTAFVQQEVPAASTTAAGKVELATRVEVIEPTSNTLAVTPFQAIDVLMHPGYVQVAQNNSQVSTFTSGAGAGIFTTSMTRVCLGPNTATAGSVYYRPQTNGGVAQFYARGNANAIINFSKKFWMSGRSCFDNTFIGDANNTARVTAGKSATGAGALAQKGIGWQKAGGSTANFFLLAHNGTTLTSVNTNTSLSSLGLSGGAPFDWSIYSDGTGNVTMWINDTQVATTSAGPTGNSAGSSVWQEEIDQTVSAATRMYFTNFSGHYYHV